MRGKAFLVAGTSLLFAWFLCTPPAKAAPSPPAPKPAATKGEKNPWDRILDEGARAGLTRLRLKATTERLAAAGIQPPEGAAILAPALEAGKRGLPWDSVLAKVDEGLLKRVAAEALAAAARSRVDSLTRAQSLVSSAQGRFRADEAKQLISATALALESGVTEASVGEVLRRGKGKPAAQLRPVVEAVEALQLAGFEPPVVEALMADCLDRNLRRQEVLRVVRFAVEKKRAGMESAAIRQALWDATPKGKNAPSPPADAQGPAPAPPPPGTPR